MLDFNNLNYFPSLFDKSNAVIQEAQLINVDKGDSITKKVDFVNTFVNNLYSEIEGLTNYTNAMINDRSTLIKDRNTMINDLDKLIHETSKSFENHDKGKELQISPKYSTHFDTLAALEGKTSSVRSSDSTEKFSTYFYYDDKPKGKHAIEALKDFTNAKKVQFNINPLNINPKQAILVDVNKQFDQLLIQFEDRLHNIADFKISFNNLLEEYDSKDIDKINTEPLDISPMAEYFSNSEDYFNDAGSKGNITSHEIISYNQKIEEMNKIILDLKAKLIEFNDQIRELDVITNEFIEFSNFKDLNSFKGDFNSLNYKKVNMIRDKLESLDEFKYKLLDEFNEKNNKINEIIARRDALLEHLVK
jgi:hypothetical protein